MAPPPSRPRAHEPPREPPARGRRHEPLCGRRAPRDRGAACVRDSPSHGGAPPRGPLRGGARVTPLVKVHDLRGGYVRGVDVLGGASFAVAPGEIVGVLGPNGGGKTTLFRALLDELPYRTGE